MVCSTILADKTATIQAEGHRQVLQRHVVDHVVVGTLHERGVDVADRVHASCGQTCREGHGMTLGNTHVEASFGHLLHHQIHRATRWHSWRDTYNFFILAGKLQQSLTKDILVACRRAWRWDTLACFGVEATRSVPYRLIILGWGVALAFGGNQVQEFRLANIFERGEQINHLLQIVSLDDAEVAEIETLKEVAVLQQALL